MASCALCKKGLREQFVASSNGLEYVRCSNGACGYFCSVKDLPSYERVVQLDVAGTFTGRDAPLCQHQKSCALRVSRSVKNAGRPLVDLTLFAETAGPLRFSVGPIWK